MTKKLIDIFVFIVLTFNSIIFGFNIKENKDNYIIKKWSIKEGIPQSSIKSLIQYKGLYIWFGTDAGLVRFDGVESKIIKIRGNNGRYFKLITSILEDRKGNLWVGSSNSGLAIWDGYNWKTISKSDGLSSNNITTIIEDTDGRIWVGTDNGLNCINERKIKVYSTLNGLDDNLIRTIIDDNKGKIWVGTSEGISFFLNGSFHSLIVKSKNFKKKVNTLVLNSSREIIVGTNSGLFRIKKGKISSYLNEIIPVNSHIKTIKILKNNVLWIGTKNHGLYKINENDFLKTFFNRKNKNIICNTILKDKENNIWVGTENNGLIRIKKRRINTILNSKLGNVINCVIKGDGDALYAGTENGIYLLKNNGNIKGNILLQGKNVKTLLKNDNEDIWVGTKNKGLFVLKNKKYINLNTNDGLISDQVNVIYKDKKKHVWIGTDKGLCFTNNKYKVIHKIVGTNGHYINVLYENNADMWIGTQKGLYSLNSQGFFKYKPIVQPVNINILSIFADESKTLFIGTKGDGLYLYRNDKWINLNEENGMLDNYIYSINKDNDGFIWFSSNKGLFKVELKELLQNFQMENYRIVSFVYDENEGMLSRECIGDGFPSSLLINKELLFCPTKNGISIINTNKKKDSQFLAKPIIEAFDVNRRQVNLTKPHSFSQEKKIFTFKISGINFNAPEKIKFQFKLEGYEEKWNDLISDQRRVITYINLEPGEYKFILKAAGLNNMWQETEMKYGFEIGIKTSVFVFIILILILIIIFFLFITLVFIKRNKKPDIKKYHTSSLTIDVSEKVSLELIRLMEVEKIYLDPELTIKNLSEKLNIHYNHLSQIINEKLNQGSKDFIYYYRINEAKKILSDNKNKNKTMTDIAFDCGFYSKSSFNRAFKKFTGKTPSEFRKEIQFL